MQYAILSRIIKHKMGIGIFYEQAIESVHHDFKNTWTLSGQET